MENVVDVKDGESPFYVKEEEAPDALSKEAEKIPQGAGSGLDSDTIQGFQAVSATAKGPNKLVATDANGDLPTAVIPAVTVAMLATAAKPPATQDATPTRAVATVYQNTTGKVMYANITIAQAAGTTYFYVDGSNPPTTEVGRQAGATEVTVTILILPTYYYKADTSGAAGVTLRSWIEWY